MLYDIEKLPKRRRFHSQFMDGFLGTDILEDYPYRRERPYYNGSYPAVNIVEFDKDYEIELAAPGLCKKDYELTIQKDTLRVHTIKKFEDNNSGRYARREFAYQEFDKTFILPENADTEAIAASCNNGILNIHIPKKVIETRARSRSIAIT